MAAPLLDGVDCRGKLVNYTNSKLFMASVWGIRFAVKETDLVPGTGDRYAPGYSGGQMQRVPSGKATRANSSPRWCCVAGGGLHRGTDADRRRTGLNTQRRGTPPCRGPCSTSPGWARLAHRARLADLSG